MKLILIILFLFPLSIFANCGNSLESLVSTDEMKSVSLLTANESFDSNQEVIMSKYVESELERRGCCSWHNGVCGCSYGRVVCCDQTYSPTCRCD